MRSRTALSLCRSKSSSNRGTSPARRRIHFHGNPWAPRITGGSQRPRTWILFFVASRRGVGDKPKDMDDDDAAAAVAAVERMLLRTEELLSSSAAAATTDDATSRVGANLFAWYTSTAAVVTTTAAATAAAKPSARSRLCNGIGRTMAENSRVFHERLRDTRLVLTMLRLHGFAAAAPPPSQQPSDSSSGGFKVTPVMGSSGGGGSDELVSAVERVMLALRRDVAEAASRCRVLDETCTRLKNEIVSLREEYDELRERAKRRYGGEWEGEVADASEERRLLDRQIDDLSLSAEKMADLLTRSNDSIRLAVQHKTVELERALAVTEEESRRSYERERGQLLAQIRIVEERTPRLEQLRHVAQQIEAIVTRVRDVIAKLTSRLIELLDARKRERERLQREVTEREEEDAAPSPPLDKHTARRVRDIAVRLLANGDESYRTFADDRNFDAYTRSLSYPTIVDSADLRTTVQARMCDLNADQALRMYARRGRRNQTYRTTRNALVACLYFYGTSASFLDTVESWYEQRMSSDNSNDEAYLSAPSSPLSLDISHRAFFTLQLDLRLVPVNVFREIVRVFRLRCQREEK